MCLVNRDGKNVFRIEFWEYIRKISKFLNINNYLLN